MDPRMVALIAVRLLGLFFLVIDGSALLASFAEQDVPERELIFIIVRGGAGAALLMFGPALASYIVRDGARPAQPDPAPRTRDVPER